MLRRFSIRRRRPSVKTFNVITLDGVTLSFNLDSRSNGTELLDLVLQECGITTADRVHFSLAVQEESYLKWVLLHKPLKRQMSGHSPYTLLFRVSIYPYDHHSFVQSLARHYLYLQIRQDIKLNRLQPSSSSVVTRITALMVQGEIGNYIPQTCSNGYIKELQILPAVTTGMEEAIKQAHRLNRGRLPGECEEEVLDLVQEEPTYGSVYYNVQDSHHQPVTLCICPVGIRVAQGGRQINCYKWESILKVTHRGKHVYIHMDSSQTLTAYQAHFVCRYSIMATSITAWCQALMRFYCSDEENSVAEESKLKRFFSTRRSLRRPGSSRVKRQALISPGSIPVQRRSRRASVAGPVINGSPSQPKKALTQRSDSKLVIYGLSGLANSQDDPEQTTPITTTTADATTAPTSHGFMDGVNNQLQHESSPSVETSGSDVFVQSSSDMQDSLEMTGTLHVIQEESTLGRRKGGGDKSEFGTGSGTHVSRSGMGTSQGSFSRRGEFGRTHSSNVKGLSGSSPSITAENASSPCRDGRNGSYEGSGFEETKREGRKGSYGGEGVPGESRRRSSGGGTRYTESRGDGRMNGYGGEDKKWDGARMNGYAGSGDTYGRHHQWKVPVQGSVADVEHKSVSSLLQQRQQEDTPLSNHTPRTHSESELARESRWDYDAEHRGSHANPRGLSHGTARSSQHRGSHRDKLASSSYSHLHHPPSPQHQAPPISPPSPHQSSSSSSYRHSASGSPYRPSSAPYKPSSIEAGRTPSRGGASPHRQSSSGLLSPHRPPSGGHTPRDTPTHGYTPTPRDTPTHGYTLTPRDTPPQGYVSPQRDPPTHVSHPEYGSSPRGPSPHVSTSRGPSPLVTSPHEYGTPQHGYSSPHHRNSDTAPQQHRPSDHSNPPHQGKLRQYSHSQSNPSLKHHQFRGGDPPQPKSGYNHWQRSSGRRGLSQGELDQYNDSGSQREDIPNGRRSGEYSPRRKGSVPVIRGDTRSSLRAYRHQHNSRDTVASENLEWDYRQGQQSPASAGAVGAKHFKYPAYVGVVGSQRNSHYQAWKAGGHHATNGTWNNDDEDNSGRISSSLPTDSKADYSLYEEDENEEGSMAAVAASRPRRMSAQDVHDSTRHVSRHKRLRHSTITSLTSLPDISGGMSRLGSIASLDYQASFAELSQADSVVSGYIDPHVRSLVFQASLTSQGTEL